MRRFIFVLALLIGASLSGRTPADEKNSVAPEPSWNRITFPPVPSPWPFSKQVSISINNEHQDGMLVSMSFVTETAEAVAELPADFFNFPVSLHTGQGKVLKPSRTDREPNGFRNGLRSTWTFTWSIPWDANVLEDGFVEVRLSRQPYLFELPYGFTRDPSASKPQSNNEKGPPVLPAQKPLVNECHLITWSEIEYRFKSKGPWQPTIRLSNPADASAQLELYKDDGLKNSDLQHPATHLSIRLANGTELAGTCMSLNRNDDGLRRTDVFKLDRHIDDSQRTWGVLTVTVDDRQFHVSVPSSLFSFKHGHAASAAGDATQAK